MKAQHPAKACRLLFVAAAALATALAGCSSTVQDTGGAPPTDSAKTVVEQLLTAIDSGDSKAFVDVAPGSSNEAAAAIIDACRPINPQSRSVQFESDNGPQAVRVTLLGALTDQPTKPGTCAWQMYWNQDRRNWTVTVVASVSGSATP
ncbi:hypothetical protein ABH923_000301 [Leifsonia sp. EB41]|uniref:hypothetical protein n=1 Tax=Leifsonia sp. EB41 TaxID=3156260 RepID=UPI0035157CFF